MSVIEFFSLAAIIYFSRAISPGAAVKAGWVCVAISTLAMALKIGAAA